MTEPSERSMVLGLSGRAVVVVGGVLLAATIFLPWYSVSLASGAGHVSGIALSGKAPELGVLPAIGLAAAMAGAVIGRVPRALRDSIAGPGAVALGLVGLAVTLEVAVRLNQTMQNLYGTSFWDAAALGWYVAMLGGFLILAAGILRVVVPAERFAPAAA